MGTYVTLPGGGGGGGGAENLDDLTDVDTVTDPPDDGDFLVYDTGTGKWAPATLTVPGSAVSVDASGFNGNLTTSDDTLQEVAQKLDDLVVGGSETLAASIIDAKGDLIVGTAADTPARLAVGSSGTLPMADAGATSGITWGRVGSGPDNLARPYIAGNFYGPVRGIIGTGSCVGGYVRCIPFIPTHSFTADRILLYSTAAASGAKARLGIYDSDGTNSLPKTLLLDAGEVALDVTAGDRLATISQVFTAGHLYWLAENHNGTYTFAPYGVPTSNYSLASNWGINGGIGSPDAKPVTAQTQTYGALPSSLTGDNAYYTNNSQWPYMMVRGA